MASMDGETMVGANIIYLKCPLFSLLLSSDFQEWVSYRQVTTQKLLSHDTFLFPVECR